MSFKGITIMTPEESLGNITAADDAAIFQSLIGSDGVLNIGSNFATTVISNNKVRVADGVLCVGGHMGRTAYGDYNDMTIENGVSGQNRNDIIYAKFLTSGSADTFTLDVKKGTGTTGTATDPALTQGVLYENATLREFPLWRVKLKGLSIVAVEQMFTLVPTIPELEAKCGELNSNLNNISTLLNSLESKRFKSTLLKRITDAQSWVTVGSLSGKDIFEVAVFTGTGNVITSTFVSKVVARQCTAAYPYQIYNGSALAVQFYVSGDTLYIFNYTGYVSNIYT